MINVSYSNPHPLMSTPKRIVIALGGNALGNNLPEQYLAVQSTAKAIADLVEEGHQVIISHGNGPQVGMIHNALTAFHASDPGEPTLIPLSVCVAMSQAYIGYDLQNALSEELKNRGLPIPVATVITQVRVEEEDPAFADPTKPIGPYLSSEEILAYQQKQIPVKEDAGRGYRRVVASPLPKEIIELPTIRHLLDAGEIVIACGGGGIPVIRREHHLKGVPAVIDKDFASALLAKELDADVLVILTAVEQISLFYGTPQAKALSHMTTEEAKAYAQEGHFAPGSMLPKVKAGIAFAESGQGKTALITLLSKAKDGILGLTGTRICS